MSYLNSEALSKILPDIITPFNHSLIKHCAYELSLGKEVYITSCENKTKQKLKKYDQIIIPPGQFALLLTEETVYVPETLISFISIKFSIKYSGLINVSGFHVDPGFRGRLKFSVYNAGPNNIILSRGQPLFLIWFSELNELTEDVYNGSHINQNSITDEDTMKMQGDIVSPASLQKQIIKQKNQIRNLQVLLGICITFLIPIIINFFIALNNDNSSRQMDVENFNIKVGTESRNIDNDEKQNSPIDSIHRVVKSSKDSSR